MGYSYVKVGMNLLKNGYGFSTFYTGYAASIGARMQFLFVRNCVYRFLYDRFKPQKWNNDLLYYEKGIISGISGIIGTLFSNSLMTKAVLQIGDVGRKEQFKRLETDFKGNKGLLANVVRAGLLNTFLIFPYNVMNEKLYVTFGDVFTNRWIAAFIASVVATAISLPFDQIRTRLQYFSSDKARNRMNYRNTLHCANVMFANEGWKSFYAGAQVATMHMFIYTMCTIYFCDVFFENMKPK